MKSRIERCRADQSAVQETNLSIAVVIVFHTVIHLLGLFALTTLRPADRRLSMDDPNLPVAPVTLVIFIASLMFLWSIVRLAALPKKRAALVALTLILLVSSAGTICYAAALRAILVRSNPPHVARLPRDTLIVDVDRRGVPSIYDVPLTRVQLREILRGVYDRQGRRPVVVCGDSRARHADVRAAIDTCAGVGLDVIGVADQSTPEYFGFSNLGRAPLTPGGAPRPLGANEAVVVIYNNLRLGGKGFVVNGEQVSPREVEEYLAGRVDAGKELKVIVKSTVDCPHGHLLMVMRICRRMGIESVSVSSM